MRRIWWQWGISHNPGSGFLNENPLWFRLHWSKVQEGMQTPASGPVKLLMLFAQPSHIFASLAASCSRVRCCQLSRYIFPDGCPVYSSLPSQSRVFLSSQFLSTLESISFVHGFSYQDPYSGRAGFLSMGFISAIWTSMSFHLPLCTLSSLKCQQR